MIDHTAIEKVWKNRLLTLFFRPRRARNKLLSTISRCSLIHPRLRTKLLFWMGVNFADPSSVFIGSNVYFDELNPHLITVGKNVYFTEGVRVLTHFYDKFQPPHHHKIGPVTIEDDVFLGINVVIADSVIIGRGAVIGANSVVTRNIPPQTIAAGTPCRPTGERPLER